MAIDIVGLGPGSPGLLTKHAEELLHGGRPVVLRTRRHPTVEALAASRAWADCDDLYQGGRSFEDVYGAIASRVAEAGASADVVYAVPGHPLVAERSVVEILRQCRDHGIEVRVHPAVSFVDLAAVALQRDFGTVQVVDALDLRWDAQRPALIGQVFDRDAATRLKLALLDVYPPDHPVVVLRALGTPEQQVLSIALEELDRSAWGYLDSVFVEALDPIDDVRRFDGLHAIVRRLHSPEGCPWDREQTHESLRRHLLEETYEVLEAIDSGDPDALAEELGDLLLQVLMHACVGERNETFEFADVAEHIARKLVRRHPHVFGDVKASTAEEVYGNWETLKKAEKPRDSVLDGVPSSLPALAASQSIQGRARRVGFDWPDMQGPLDKLVEELGEIARAETGSELEAEFGDLLFVAAGIGQRLGVDAEQALRVANVRFRRRFGWVEREAARRGQDLKDLDIDALVGLWTEAKAALAAEEGNPLGVS